MNKNHLGKQWKFAFIWTPESTKLSCSMLIKIAFHNYPREMTNKWRQEQIWIGNALLGFCLLKSVFQLFVEKYLRFIFEFSLLFSDRHVDLYMSARVESFSSTRWWNFARILEMEKQIDNEMRNRNNAELNWKQDRRVDTSPTMECVDRRWDETVGCWV